MKYSSYIFVQVAVQNGGDIVDSRNYPRRNEISKFRTQRKEIEVTIRLSSEIRNNSMLILVKFYYAFC